MGVIEEIFLGATDFSALAIGGLGTTAVIYIVFMAIVYFNLFEKLGEKEWKALIPVYNSYTLYKLTGQANLFWITFIIAVAATLITVVLGMIEVTSAIVVMIFAIINTVVNNISTAVRTITTYLVYKDIAKKFGFGIIFTIGMVVCPIIFLSILAFNKETYVKEETHETDVTEENNQEVYNEEYAELKENIEEDDYYN